jgi:hypothetical protein
MPITQVALSNTFNEFRVTVNDIANTVNAVTPVTLGGTGLATLTANSLIVGAGTANVTFVSPGSANNVLTSNGTNWISTALPAAGLSYVYKTANYTTQNLEGVLANTAAVGAFTVTLPPVGGLSVGSQVVISDAGNFWGTNNLTIGRNGATISDIADNLVCDISGASVQLVYDGTTWEVYAQVGGNGGNVVVGPGSSTDNAITRFNSITGKLIQNSLVTIADDGAITAPQAGSVIPFYYANTSVFPSASTYRGAVAYSNANTAMYFANNSVWVRILETGGPLGTPSSGIATNLTGLPLTTGVTGTLPIANGGTGTTSNTFVNLTTNVTGTLPIANGGTGTTSNTFVNLTTNVTQRLPIANGGTNSNSAPTAGAISYGTGTAFAFSTIGTVGQVLISNGASAPFWEDFPSTPSFLLINAGVS